MNVKKRIRTLLLAATALGALGATAHAEVDHYPGAMCQQMWTSTPRVHVSDSTMYNPTNTAATVTCPLTMDDGNGRHYKKTWMNVRDTQSTDDVQCRIMASDFGGDWRGEWRDSGTVQTGNRVFELGATFRGRANSITCQVPGNAAAGYFIYRYGGEKN